MPRDLSTDFLAQLNAPSKRPIIFYEGEFATDTLRLCTEVGNVEWDSKTWVGAGLLAGLSTITDTGTLQANGVIGSLSGINADVLALLLTEARQGKAGTWWLWFLDDDGAVIDSPEIVFAGVLDVPALEDNGDEATASIAYESVLRRLEQPNELRYTHEAQQVLFPGDKGFEYVPGLQDWNGTWGKA